MVRKNKMGGTMKKEKNLIGVGVAIVLVCVVVVIGMVLFLPENHAPVFNDVSVLNEPPADLNEPTCYYPRILTFNGDGSTSESMGTECVQV
jgi:hypothetical protein